MYSIWRYYATSVCVLIIFSLVFFLLGPSPSVREAARKTVNPILFAAGILRSIRGYSVTYHAFVVVHLYVDYKRRTDTGCSKFEITVTEVKQNAFA